MLKHRLILLVLLVQILSSACSLRDLPSCSRGCDDCRKNGECVRCDRNYYISNFGCILCLPGDRRCTLIISVGGSSNSNTGAIIGGIVGIIAIIAIVVVVVIVIKRRKTLAVNAIVITNGSVNPNVNQNAAQQIYQQLENFNQNATNRGIYDDKNIVIQNIPYQHNNNLNNNLNSNNVNNFVNDNHVFDNDFTSTQRIRVSKNDLPNPSPAKLNVDDPHIDMKSVN